MGKLLENSKLETVHFIGVGGIAANAKCAPTHTLQNLTIGVHAGIVAFSVIPEGIHTPVCKSIGWTKIKWAVVTRGLQVHVARMLRPYTCATTADPTDGGYFDDCQATNAVEIVEARRWQRCCGPTLDVTEKPGRT
jgi:hypothetical protein